GHGQQRVQRRVRRDRRALIAPGPATVVRPARGGLRRPGGLLLLAHPARMPASYLDVKLFDVKLIIRPGGRARPARRPAWPAPAGSARSSARPAAPPGTATARNRSPRPSPPGWPPWPAASATGGTPRQRRTGAGE